MSRPIRLGRESILKSLGFLIYVYIFIGFMVVPCFNTLASVFSTVRPDGSRDPLAVIRFFFAGNMPSFVWNSLKLALALVVTVNVVGVSIVLLTEYFDIKGARILRLGYMTTMIYSGVALVTGYLFLYAGDGIITTQLVKIFPDMNKDWFSGFRAVWFTMTFCKYSDGTVYLEDVNLIPTWVDLRTTNGRYYYILPLDGTRMDDWQTQLELSDVGLAAATRSYNRTMAIVGDGLVASLIRACVGIVLEILAENGI